MCGARLRSGALWVCLKGALPPAMRKSNVAPEVYYARAVKGLVPPLNFSKAQAWAVWRIHPSLYDESKPANG